MLQSLSNGLIQPGYTRIVLEDIRPTRARLPGYHLSYTVIFAETQNGSRATSCIRNVYPSATFRHIDQFHKAVQTGSAAFFDPPHQTPNFSPGHRCFQTTAKPIPASEPQGTPYTSLIVGIPREIFPNERRVSLTPQNAALLRKKGFSKILVEHNAGLGAQFLDEHYAAAGAALVPRDELFKQSDILLKVRPPLIGQEVERIREGSSVISFLYPAQNRAIVDTLAQRNVNVFAVCYIHVTA